MIVGQCGSYWRYNTRRENSTRLTWQARQERTSTQCVRNGRHFRNDFFSRKEVPNAFEVRKRIISRVHTEKTLFLRTSRLKPKKSTHSVRTKVWEYRMFRQWEPPTHTTLQSNRLQTEEYFRKVFFFDFLAVKIHSMRYTGAIELLAHFVMNLNLPMS